MQRLKEAWLKMIRAANTYGVPVPLLRDNKTGFGSMSLTLVFISFNVWLASVIGKIAGVLGGMNPGDCLNMFLACAGLYYGRKFQKDGEKVELDSEVKKAE